MAVKLTVWRPQPASYEHEKELFVELTGLNRPDEVMIRLVDSNGLPVPHGSLMVLTPRGYYPPKGLCCDAAIAVDATKGGRMKELTRWPL